MVSTKELNNLLRSCHSVVNNEPRTEWSRNLESPIAQLRVWGRDPAFCATTIGKTSFLQIVQLLQALNIVEHQDLVISLFATLSNAMLASREIAHTLAYEDLIDLTDRALEIIAFINETHTYSEDLVAIILPPIRFIYLITVDKLLVEKYPESEVSRILDMLHTQYKLFRGGVCMHENDLVLIDILKIGYSISHSNGDISRDETIALLFELHQDNDVSEDVSIQFANYISFFPIPKLKKYERQLIDLVDLYISILSSNSDENIQVSVLNFFNHLASLSEALYLDDHKSLIEVLRRKFVPQDDSNIPGIYTTLMKIALNDKSAKPLEFGSRNNNMLKNLTLDLYLKIMGNNIEHFMNEIGIFLSMDFIKLKGNEKLKVFAQDDLLKMKNNTGMYPLHYNLIEENKKTMESQPELTEEEKEEEWEKLMDVFDKMKKNGMIKMVGNPLDAMENY